jgi:hypothetical protein
MIRRVMMMTRKISETERSGSKRTPNSRDPKGTRRAVAMKKSCLKLQCLMLRRR